MFPTFISILDIQSWWEVPSISHFCSLFRTVFNLLDFDIEDLEEALLADGTEETSWLQELIVLLLKGCLPNNEISVFNYQMFLRRLFRKKCQEHDLTNPFNTDIDFQLLPLRAKVDILRALCDFRLDAEDVLEQLKNLEAESLRVEPLGYDCNKSAYWYFYGTRLYREDFPKSRKPIWQVICFTLNDWSQLVKKFEHSHSKSEQLLFHTLNENFIPELPRLFKEKESLARKRLIERLPRRSSKRLKNKVDEEEQKCVPVEEEKKRLTEEEYRREREEERRKREERIREFRKRTYEDRLRKKEELSDGFDSEHSDGRYEMAGAKAKDKKSKTKARKDENKDNGATNRTSNRNVGKGLGKQEVDAKPVGRQTNNSLASATGQILIQPVANPHRKKLKTSQVFSQSEEDLQTGLHKILDHVKNHDDAWPFIEPVEEEYAPNYYSIIRKPMDLQRMEERLESGHYKTFSKFKTDFQLIVNNCRLYNGADNEYTEMVDNLLETFERAVERYLDQITSSDEEIAVEYPDLDKDKNKKKKDLLPSKRKPTLAAQTDRKKERSPSVESLKKEESPVEDLEEEEEEYVVPLKKKKDEVVKNNKKGVKVNKKEVKGKKVDLIEEKEAKRKLREESEEKEVKGKKTDKNKKVKEEEERKESKKVKKEDVKGKKEEKSKDIIKNKKEELKSKSKEVVEEKELSKTKKAEETRTKKLEEKKKEEAKKKVEESKAKKIVEEAKAKKLEEAKAKEVEAKAKKVEEAKAKKAEEAKAKKEEIKKKTEEIKNKKIEKPLKNPPKETPPNKKPLDSPKKNKKEPEKKPPIKKPEEKVKPKPVEPKKVVAPVVKDDKKVTKKRRRSLSPSRSKSLSRSPSRDRWSSSPPPSWPPSSPEASSPKKKKCYSSEDDEIDNKGKHKQKNDKWKEIFKEEKSTEKKPQLEETPPKHKDKHNKLRETIEKLKAKSDLTKLKEKDLKVYDFDSEKTKENKKDVVQPSKKIKKDTKINKKDDYEDGNSTADDSVQSDNKNKKKGTNSKTAGAKNSTIEALTLATEQTLKDINKWLDDTPRISDYSSTSNSPSHFPAIEEIDGLNNKSEQDKKKSDKPVVQRKDGVKDGVKKRPFQRDPAKFLRRKEVQRTIDRLQPGKSKGNLISNVQSTPKPDDLFPLGSLSKIKDTKNSLIVKTDDSAPKLSLGSVLDSFGEHKFVDDEVKEEKDEKEPKEDKKEQVEEKIVESKEETKVEPPKLDNSPGKATPNLSAWFKAFGAPKIQPTTTKKPEKEDKADTDNKKEDINIKKVTVAEPSPTPESPLMQPIPRQRKISTGSSMSERSSFSQDLDSPRVGIDERLGAYPAPYPSPLHKSPSGASPNIQSPRPDISPKYNFNGQMRVGFYQDTVSTKSSPDKSCSPRDNPQSPYSQYPDIYQNSQNYSYSSPYYSQPPNYSTSNPTPPYNNEQSNQGYYDTNKPLTDQYQAKNVNSPVNMNQANSPVASQQSPINQSSQDSPIHQQPSPITNQNPPSVESYQQPSPLDMLTMDNYRQNQQMSPQMDGYRQNQAMSPKVDQYGQNLNQNDLSQGLNMDKYRQNINQDLDLQKELSQELNQQDPNRQNLDLSRQNMSQQEHNRQHQDLSRQSMSQQDLTHQNLPQQELRQTVQQQNLNQGLPQQDLSRQTMNQQQNLSQQDLSRQNLSQQDLTMQNLPQQDLTRQNMTQQDMTRQNMSQQNITDLTQNELPRQNLSRPQEIPARQDLTRLDLTQQDLSQNLGHLPRQNLAQHQNLQGNMFGQESYQQQQQQVDSYRQQEQFRQDGVSGREKQGAAATAAATNFPVKKRAYNEVEQVGKFDERIAGKFEDRLLSHAMDPVRLMRMQSDQVNTREPPKYVHQNIPEPRSLNPQQTMLQTQQQTPNQETNTLGLRNVNFPNATNPYNYNADSYPLNIPSATRTLEPERKDMSKFNNMGYNSPDMNFVRNQQQFNTKTSSNNEQNQLRYSENNVMNMGNYKGQQAGGNLGGNPTENPGRLSEVSVPRPTYSAPTSIEMDPSLIRGNLANLSHIVDRYPNDDRMLSGLQSGAPPPYYGDKNMPGQHMFPKPIATSTSAVPMFSQPNAMSYAHNIQSTNAMYNRPMAELQNSAAMLGQDRPATLQQPLPEPKKTKRRKTNKNATPPTSIIDTNPSSTTTQGFQSYTGLKNPTSMEPSAISLKTASVVPGSAFNFGPTATGLGLSTSLYDKDAYPNYLEDFRSAPNYYMAAAAAAHHRSTPEGGEKPPVRAAHQSSNPQPTPGGYPFIGAPQPRPGYPPLGGHFMPPHQGGLMDTSSPLYQQYLQAGVLHHQGLLPPPPGAYPPGYLSMRQPYDSMTRPFF